MTTARQRRGQRKRTVKLRHHSRVRVGEDPKGLAAIEARGRIPDPPPTSSDALIQTMTPACRAAFVEYESHYLGGMGGGRHTAAKAFKAAWDTAAGFLERQWARLEANSTYPRVRMRIALHRDPEGFVAIVNQVSTGPHPTPQDAIAASVDAAKRCDDRVHAERKRASRK